MYLSSLYWVGECGATYFSTRALSYLVCALTISIPFLTISLRFVSSFSAQWSMSFIVSSLTLTCNRRVIGSVVGRPVRGIDSSPLFCTTISINFVLPKVNTEFQSFLRSRGIVLGSPMLPESSTTLVYRINRRIYSTVSLSYHRVLLCGALSTVASHRLSSS